MLQPQKPHPISAAARNAEALFEAEECYRDQTGAETCPTVKQCLLSGLDVHSAATHALQIKPGPGKTLKKRTCSCGSWWEIHTGTGLDSTTYITLTLITY